MNIMNILFLIGRILLGGYFIFNCINHFTNLSGLTAYANTKKVVSPKVAVIATGILFGIGGLSIVLGFYIVLGMWLLVLALIPITFIMHRFWTSTDPMERMSESVNFFKNLALIGGLLMLSSLFAIIG